MNSNSEQQFIIVKGAGGGGLGDRIRCVLSGIAYANLTGRVLFVDWSDGKLIPEHSNVFSELFSLEDISNVDHCPSSEDVRPIAWQGKLSESLHTLYTQIDPEGWDRAQALEKLSFDQANLNYPNQTLVMWDFDQFDELAKLLKQESQKLAQDLAQTHLRPSQQIIATIEDFKSKNFTENETIIGIHIRATNEFDKIKSSVRLDQYINTIRRILKSHSDSKIFLATDNADVESLLAGKFPGKVISRNKWFAKPGERLHFNDDCPEPMQALVDAMVEMLLLAECDHLIYQQNSSFGKCAHIFSKASEQYVTPLFARQSLQNRLKNKVSSMLSS